MEPMYPEIVVTLSDGNAFDILGAVRKAMRQAGLELHVIQKYTDEAISGDYDHLLQVTMKYVEVEP